jgi:small-conductance mechanosensitive channel
MLGFGSILLVLTAAVAAHAFLRLAERRLPLWLARRAGDASFAALSARRHAVGLALLAPKLAVWATAGFFVSERLPALMAARDRLALLVSSSFMAPLVRMGERAWSALDLLELPLLLAAVWIGASFSTRIVKRQLARAGGGAWSGGDTFATLARYVLTGAGALVVLQVWGFDVSSLALFGGVLGVGLGFGLQNVTSNFVSGLLLSFERPIKPGDFVTLGELSGTVLRIGARSTEIRTPDHVSILVPNSRFLEQEVVNWSHGSPLCKLHAPVGVAYGSDPARVRVALLEAARNHPKIASDPRPTVDLDGFGADALLFDLEFWTRDPQDQKEILASLNYRIEASLRRHRIAIPFPQRDLHLRSPELLRAIEAWSRREFPELAVADAAAAPAAAAPAPEHEHEHEVESSPAFWSDAQLVALAERMRAPGGVAIADRRHRLATYRRCFVGSDAVRWLVEREGLTRAEAILVGQRLVEQGLLHHVLDEHGFEDAHLFYRFATDEPPETGKESPLH